MRPDELETVPVGGFVFLERSGKLTPIKKSRMSELLRVRTVYVGLSSYLAYFISGSQRILVANKPVRGEVIAAELIPATPEALTRWKAQEAARAAEINRKAEAIVEECEKAARAAKSPEIPADPSPRGKPE